MSRNILEYPITREEAVKFLDRQIEEIGDLWDEDFMNQPIGTMDMLIMTKIRDYILNADESVIDWIFAE